MEGLHLTKKKYLFDTHALVFWHIKEFVSEDFIAFFDRQSKLGNLLISSISFWEVALLTKKGRLDIADTQEWKNEIVCNSSARLIEPTVSEMIDSVMLPDHHEDPFDRLLISQAKGHNAVFVTRDEIIKMYSVTTFWL